MTDQTRETTKLPRTQPREFQWPESRRAATRPQPILPDPGEPERQPKPVKPRRAAEPGYVVRGWVFALLVMLAIIPTILVIAAEVGW